jgi:peptidoglycan hydrolase-like protein with peptidoglycan-binding domain
VKRKTWALAGAAALVAVTATGGVVVTSGSKEATAAPQGPPANTVAVQKGALSSMVSVAGILAFRARPDGSPYSAINQAHGIYTKLPDQGDKVGCGDVLYRVDDDPVLLLCGAIPAYRDLHLGDQGSDVRELNRNLHVLGYDAGGGAFTAKTKQALKRLQHARGSRATGALDLGAAVVLPKPSRISKLTGALGEPARPGAPVAQATSDTLEVQVNLEPSQQREVKTGDHAQITLPDNTVATGTVDRLGKVARTAGDKDDAGSATVPAYISLAEPKRAGGLDHAPVQVEITTEGVQSALSVPVLALVGKSGGGFAVEVVRAGGRRELVAVELGLFDTAGGRVQVEGDIDAGERVVVPSL